LAEPDFKKLEAVFSMVSALLAAATKILNKSVFILI